LLVLCRWHFSDSLFILINCLVRAKLTKLTSTVTFRVRKWNKYILRSRQRNIFFFCSSFSESYMLSCGLSKLMLGTLIIIQEKLISYRSTKSPLLNTRKTPCFIFLNGLNNEFILSCVSSNLLFILLIYRSGLKTSRPYTSHISVSRWLFRDFKIQMKSKMPKHII
jgi:hypothetical protein